MIKIGIVGSDTENIAEVSGQRGLIVETQESLPLPLGSKSIVTLFQQFLTSNGLSDGTKQMNVNGSVTNQVFYIPSDSTRDIYIKRLVLWLSDSSVSYKTFGALSTLTNGFQLYFQQNGLIRYIFPSAKDDSDLILFDGRSFQELININAGNDDGFIVNIEMPFDVRIGRGTYDKLEAKVRDNLTGLVEFTLYAVGYYKEDI